MLDTCVILQVVWIVGGFEGGGGGVEAGSNHFIPHTQKKKDEGGAGCLA